jgi:cytochrome c biogenesis factor
VFVLQGITVIFALRALLDSFNRVQAHLLAQLAEIYVILVLLILSVQLVSQGILSPTAYHVLLDISITQEPAFNVLSIIAYNVQTR